MERPRRIGKLRWGFVGAGLRARPSVMRPATDKRAGTEAGPYAKAGVGAHSMRPYGIIGMWWTATARRVVAPYDISTNTNLWVCRVGGGPWTPRVKEDRASGPMIP